MNGWLIQAAMFVITVGAFALMAALAKWIQRKVAPPRALSPEPPQPPRVLGTPQPVQHQLIHYENPEIDAIAADIRRRLEEESAQQALAQVEEARYLESKSEPLEAQPVHHHEPIHHDPAPVHHDQPSHSTHWDSTPPASDGGFGGGHGGDHGGSGGSW